MPPFDMPDSEQKVMLSHISTVVYFSFGFLRISETEEWYVVEPTLGHMSYYTKNTPWALEEGKELAEIGKPYL